MGTVTAAVPPAYAAIVLAGGSARRLGGRHKPGIPVGGVPLLDRVLNAVPDARPRIVVGPPQPVPPDVFLVLEEPAGGGPVAATAAGLGRLVAGRRPIDGPPGRSRDSGGPQESGVGAVGAGSAGVGSAGVGSAGVDEPPELAAVLAADLPFLTPAAIIALRDAAGRPGQDGALYVDGDGRRQLLCGVWRTAALRTRLDAFAAPAGVGMHRLLTGLRVVELRTPSGDPPTAQPPPWYDCDTDEDVRRAEEWSQ